MKLMTQSYNNGGSAYNAEAEETSFLHYRLSHRFNEPAEAYITLADPTGSIAQKYNVDANDVYIGAGKVTIEDPTGTDIFYGRIIKATANTTTRTVELYCQDWLSQLDDEQIDYDMREDLDGSGLRESVIYPDYDNGDANGIKPATNVEDTYYVYDHEMSWDADEWNSMYMIFSDRMAGNIQVKTGPVAYTVTAGEGEVDIFDNDIGDLWTEDTDKHSVGDVGGNWDVIYQFRVWTPDSSNWYESCTGARVHMIIGLGSDVYLQLYNGATYDTFEENIGTASAITLKKTIEIPDNLLSTMFDVSGDVKLKFKDDDDGGIYVYYLAVECDFITTGYSSSISITDTIANRLTVGTDLSTEATKVWHGLPYAIARPIYKHIDSAETPGTLITANDDMETLTCAATIEHTSGISTRAYTNKTPLEILQDLRTQDKAEFWIGLGGTTVNWKSTWNDDTADETLTDTDVNSWTQEFDWLKTYNKVLARGMRIADRQLESTYTDSTSTAKYNATRSKIVHDAGLVSEYDTLAKATAIVGQLANPQKMLICTIRGNTATAAHDNTIVLGDEIQITSTYLGLTNEWYIVYGFDYDTKDHMTRLMLHPRVSTTGLQKDEFTSPEKGYNTYRKGPSDKYVPAPEV
jgi:hypothetical protein